MWSDLRTHRFHRGKPRNQWTYTDPSETVVSMIINEKTKTCMTFDVIDLPFAKQHSWYLAKDKGGNLEYARANSKLLAKRITLRFHRSVMQCPGNMQVDHMNRNGICNERSNLSIVTSQQNSCNRKLSKKSTTQVNGVYHRVAKETYHAYGNDKDGVYKSKYFYYRQRDQCTQEEAFEQAKEWREKLDDKTGNKNGHDV